MYAHRRICVHLREGIFPMRMRAFIVYECTSYKKLVINYRNDILFIFFSNSFGCSETCMVPFTVRMMVRLH